MGCRSTIAKERKLPVCTLVHRVWGRKGQVKEEEVRWGGGREKWQGGAALGGSHWE